MARRSHDPAPVRAASRSRRQAKIVLDAGVVGVAVLLAYLIRFEGYPPKPASEQMLLLLVALPIMRVLANWVARVYAHSWRLSGIPELLRLVTVALFVTMVILLFRIPNVAFHPQLAVPFSVVALEGLLTVFGMAGMRVIARVATEELERSLHRREAPSLKHRALLVGAGRTGLMAVRELAARPDMGYEVKGLVDDDPSKVGQLIHGVRVLGGVDEIGRVAVECGADVVILTIPSATREQVKVVADRCAATGLPLHTVPGFYQLVSGKVQITKIRPVQIEDLLGRQVVLFDPEKWKLVTERFGGKRILVTGAGGSIGSELCRQLTRAPAESLLLVENHENNLFDIEREIRAEIGDKVVACLADVRDEARMSAIFEEFRPEVVFHAAAFKHVPMMEAHPPDAIDNNVRGTATIARVADRNRVESFVMISTDKAVNPTSVMGASKRIAELAVQSIARRSQTNFSCVRFGNVLGSRGSVVHIFQKQIEQGGPVTVTHADATRYFMTIPEAVQLVIQAGAIGKGGEIFLLDMGEPVKIVELAEQMIRLAGRADDVEIAITGLRPGEKIVEELLLATVENAEPTGLTRISSTRPAPIDPELFSRQYDTLLAAAARRDEAGVRRILQDMAIGYRADGIRDEADPVASAKRRRPSAPSIQPA